MPTGLVALVVVGVWLAYFVPARLRTRQRVADARVEDRFSDALRVVAVGGGPAVAGSPVRTRADAASATQILPVGGSRRLLEGSDIGGTMDHTAGPSAAVRAERRAAARRRAILAGTLLAATVVMVVLGAVTAMPMAWALVPFVLLAAVLVAGRRTVVAQQRRDAAHRAQWEDAAEEEVVVEGADAAAGPSATVRAAVDVHAVRHYARPATGAVAAAVVARAATAAQRVVGDAADESVSAGDVVDDGLTAWSLRPARAAAVEDEQTEARTEDAAAQPAASAVATAPVVSAARQGAESAAVPRPTYTVKAAAPQWEPAPLSAEIERVARRHERWDAEDGVATAGDAAALEADASGADSDEDEASTGALGGALDSVLERRRAVGE